MNRTKRREASGDKVPAEESEPEPLETMSTHPTDYTKAHAGDGKKTTLDPGAWKPWKHSKPVTREEVRNLAAGKYLREAGFSKGRFEKPHTFTVWHYREGDPCHPNGSPMTVHAITMIAHPEHATLTT